jgi:hypothetical protein
MWVFARMHPTLKNKLSENQVSVARRAWTIIEERERERERSPIYHQGLLESTVIVRSTGDLQLMC